MTGRAIQDLQAVVLRHTLKQPSGTHRDNRLDHYSRLKLVGRYACNKRAVVSELYDQRFDTVDLGHVDNDADLVRHRHLSVAR